MTLQSVKITDTYCHRKRDLEIFVIRNIEKFKNDQNTKILPLSKFEIKRK